MGLINNFYFKVRSRFSYSCPLIYNFCEKHKLFCKFIFAGCLSGGLDLLILFLLHGVFGLALVLSTSIAFIFSFLSSFTLQKVWTFRNFERDKVWRQLVIYFFDAFFGLNLNALLMHILVNRLGLWYILAQILVNLLIGLINFLVYHFIIFKKNHENTI
jgi:putative flippase GtrA